MSHLFLIVLMSPFILCGLLYGLARVVFLAGLELIDGYSEWATRDRKSGDKYEIHVT